MNPKNPYIEILRKSYLLLKRETYYEHIDLFLREMIVNFDNGDIDSKLNEIQRFLQKKKLDDPWFEEQLNSINVNFLPKKIQSDQNQPNIKNFITNLRTQDDYKVDEINYFFSGNIQIYILSMLWSVLVGPYVDQELSEYCYGNRLDLDKEGKNLLTDYRIFKLYINQYNNWRDGAIQIGLDSLENRNDVLLIALDIKQCFYHLQVNWEQLTSLIGRKTAFEDQSKFIFLTKIIEKIHKVYFERTKSYLEKTHKLFDGFINTIGIPVGLPSSRILANWELKRFDEDIQNKLRPIFYGRYVDDILITLNNPSKEVVKGGKIEAILNEYFINNKILEVSNSSDTKKTFYKVIGYENLYIQDSKIIMHYYDHDHSWAGLKEFKEELKQKASEFRFLPDEDQYKDLVDEAYDIQYDGSIYRFRSVIGISENVTKLSHYLYKQQLKYWLCNDNLRDKTIGELFRFYRGKNIFDYCRLWERVFTLFIISEKYKDFYLFNRDLEKTINKLIFVNDEILSQKIKNDCMRYRKIAIDMAIGYMGVHLSKERTSSQFISLVLREVDGQVNRNGDEYIISSDSLPYKFRKSMYLRHQNVIWPLLDYSTYKGNLTKLDWSALKGNIQLESMKIDNSTRFIQLDEYLLFKYLQNILSIENDSKPQDEKSVNNGIKFFHFNEFLSKQIQEDKDDIDYTRIKSLISTNISFKRESDEKLHVRIKSEMVRKELCLGIANIKVNEKDIEASYNPRKTPNNNYLRQIILFNLINQGIKDPPCDLIIFPEVSIPFAWLPFMVSQSRRCNIGFVFGVEHVVIGEYALNLVATVLPFKNEKQFHNVYLSLRLKNHYSPNELHELSLFNLKRPEFGNLYEKFSWRGVAFPVYNCYELTDINHRALFRSEIDLLVAVEYNKDVNYFSNILEAVTRDIHCYAVQANSSDYGDSRVISPQMTEKMNIIRVKGGENAVLLKTILNIESLRDFQSREYSPNHNEFKPTPAGFDHKLARKRT